MYEPLIPCPSCRRHVRAAAACPFCDAALPSDIRAVPSSSTRLSRGALFAFAVSVTACGGSTESEVPTVTDTGGKVTDTGTATSDTRVVDDTGGPVAAYGAPADTGTTTTDSATTDSATTDTGTKDSATTDTGTKDTAIDDDGGPAPAYGLPPSDPM